MFAISVQRIQELEEKYKTQKIRKKVLYRNNCGLSPKIYIIVKQLSNAKPTTNRNIQNDIKLYENAVAIPPINPSILVPTKAGIRPYRSAIKPNNNPPTIAPQKNIDCATDGNAPLSQTHSN